MSRVSLSIRDGLSCFVSDNAEVSAPEGADYVSLFSRRVSGFDVFSTEQKVSWVLSVPKDDRYIGFLMEHIARLPDNLRNWE